MIWANRKAFICRQGSYTMNVLHPSLLKSFALSICSRDPMTTSTLGYFWKSMNGQMHRKLQPWWFFGRWLLCSVLQVEISHPHITSHVLCVKSLQIFIYGESDFVNSVSRNTMEKYTFLWFKTRDFYFQWEQNICEFFQKIC